MWLSASTATPDTPLAETVQMDMQQRRAGGGDALAQRLLDVLDVIEPLAAIDVDDQMRARAAHAMPHGKMVGAILGLRRHHLRQMLLSSRSALCSFHPLEK